MILNLAYVYGLYTCMNVRPLGHAHAHRHTLTHMLIPYAPAVDACVGNALVNVHSNACIHCKLIEHLRTNEL
jgi:hypothetical protein